MSKFEVSPTRCRPNLAMSVEELDEAKVLVLDLLGWGLDPEDLIRQGVSKECLVPVLRELGLRLPRNIDLTGFPFYDPPSDYDARSGTSRASGATVLRAKRAGESKETTAPPEVKMEDSYPRRSVKKEDKEVAAINESHTPSHSSRVSQTAAVGRPTSRAASATTSSSTEQMKTESIVGGDIPIPSQTKAVIVDSSNVPTPRGHQKSHDDAHSVPDSIASSAKASPSEMITPTLSPEMTLLVQELPAGDPPESPADS